MNKRKVRVQYLIENQQNLRNFAVHALFVWINLNYKDPILLCHTVAMIVERHSREPLLRIFV